MDSKLLIDENGNITMELKLIRNHIMNIDSMDEVIRQELLKTGINFDDQMVRKALASLIHAAFDVAVKIVTDIQAKPEILKPAAAIAGLSELTKMMNTQGDDSLNEMLKKIKKPTNREDLN